MDPAQYPARRVRQWILLSIPSEESARCSIPPEESASGDFGSSRHGWGGGGGFGRVGGGKSEDSLWRRDLSALGPFGAEANLPPNFVGNFPPPLIFVGNVPPFLLD